MVGVGMIMYEEQLSNGVDGQKQNELWILLPGARKLDFLFNTLTVDEASVLASGKQIEYEGWRV